MQLLIQHGADVTARDDTHSTPLHLAASKGCAETVDVLIQHGSDVNAKDVNLSTPLHLAASSHLKLEGTIVRLLLLRGANAVAKDSEGRTPLDIPSREDWINAPHMVLYIFFMKIFVLVQYLVPVIVLISSCVWNLSRPAFCARAYHTRFSAMLVSKNDVSFL